MDELNIGNKIVNLLKKYRFALAILLLGIILMSLPEKNEQANDTTQPVQQEKSTDDSVRLEEILAHIQGAGKVKLYLSIASGEKINYQTDEDITTDENTSQIRRETVIITGSDRGESALVTQVDPPRYLGAVVVCQGADSAAVRLAIVDAVSKATGLGTDKITVLKMK